MLQIKTKHIIKKNEKVDPMWMIILNNNNYNNK